ncbi:hypothetical protein CFP56_028046 [Quercus suber]|uniref:Uncharacterized protein n=1 Tax=Quercus suber TaxID=58331 RepID=A0AAW0JWD8_QUESU
MVEELQPPVELLTFHPNDGKVVFLHLAVPWSCATCGRGVFLLISSHRKRFEGVDLQKDNLLPHNAANC